MILDVEFITVMVLRGPFREQKKHDNHKRGIPLLDVHPDVHLDVRFIMVIVLGLSLNSQQVLNVGA